jgi:hypothetical protein
VVQADLAHQKIKLRVSILNIVFEVKAIVPHLVIKYLLRGLLRLRHQSLFAFDSKLVRVPSSIVHLLIFIVLFSNSRRYPSMRPIVYCLPIWFLRLFNHCCKPLTIICSLVLELPLGQWLSLNDLRMRLTIESIVRHFWKHGPKPSLRTSQVASWEVALALRFSLILKVSIHWKLLLSWYSLLLGRTQAIYTLPKTLVDAKEARLWSRHCLEEVLVVR